MGFYVDSSGQRTHRDEPDELDREDKESLRPSPGKSSRTHGGGDVLGIPGKISLTVRLAQHIDRFARAGYHATPDEHARDMVAQALRSTGHPESFRRELKTHVGHEAVVDSTPPLPSAPSSRAAWSAPVMRQPSDQSASSPNALDLHEAIEFQGGYPLPEPVRHALERRFGVALSGVRVHTDESAALATAAVCANAFTIGDHIYFSRGKFSPDTEEGHALLVHELTHVVQWYQGRIAYHNDGLTISDPADPLEREAESVGRLSSQTALEYRDAPPATLRQAAPKAMATPALSAAAIYRQERQGSISVAQCRVAVSRGNRRYSISIVLRGQAAFVEVSPVGTPEVMTVPIGLPGTAATTLSLASSEVGPDASLVRFVTGAGAEVRVEVIPSQIYQANQDRNRPDRVRVSDGHSTVEKDVYPAGANHSLSSGDAVLSTVVAMPPSGTATEPANVLVELAPNSAGATLTLCLQKTSQRNTAQIPEYDGTAEPASLVGIQELPADGYGNQRRQVSIRIPGQNARTVELELISWRQTGTVQEGYTWRLRDPANDEDQTGGFTNPPSSAARDFHRRVLDARPGRREVLTGDQTHGIQLVTASAGGLTFGFFRETPEAATVQVHISSQGDSTTRTLPYSGAVLSPIMVDDSGGDQGSLSISLDGSGTRHMSVSWTLRQGSRELPRLESGTGHVVLGNYSQTQVDLQIWGLGAEPIDLQWAWPPLPDDVVAPPKWRRWSNGYETGWIRDSGSRMWIPDRVLYPQIQGAQIAGMLFDITAISAIRMIPIVGPLVMIGEAVAGREIITGRGMSDDERMVHGALAGLGLVVELGVAYAATRGSGGAASGAASTQVRQVVTATQLSEVEAQNLLTVATRVTAEERALVTAARAELAAGRQLTQSQLNQLRNIMARVHSEMLAEARQALLNTLQARNAAIEAARGDINAFRINFRGLAAAGNVQRPLTEISGQLNQLLTPYRRMRLQIGGGRGASAQSTIIESLDGQFSIRITHSQVGPAPIGSPPHPRIHIYRGTPSGHGSHILLPDGTTLADILAALGF